jgi:hypothetical protein
MHGCGSVADAVMDIETPLVEVKNVVNQIVMVQTREAASQWPGAQDHTHMLIVS